MKIIANFEVVLMVISIFAFAFIIHEATSVFAQSSELGCCSTTIFDEKCAAVYQDECKEDSLYALGSGCEQTSFCQTGCCYDDAIGIYDSNVIKGDCELDWDDDPRCNLPGAKKGCCVLSNFVIFETRGQCEVDSLMMALGVDTIVDWRGDLSEWECLTLMASEEEGACILSGGTCKRSSEVDCYNYGGGFSKGYLCTSDLLNTSCEKTELTTCVEDKDGVYFLDSCGNYANIYDSSKVENESYWGEIIDGVDSCGFNSEDGNANSTNCGNCDRFNGGMCASVSETGFKVDVGDYYCKDLSCMFDGEIYKNGESWCVYDGKIGDGDDIVGSRHWRYICSQGEVLLEPCADYRNELCAQVDTFNISEEESGFRNVICVKNNWRSCLAISAGEGEGEDPCGKAMDCRTEGITIGENEENFCLPNYPPGLKFMVKEFNENRFDRSSDKKENKAVEQCGIASQTCTVSYTKKNSWSSWKCAVNCVCEEAGYIESLHNFCTSLGDCGAYVNILGEVTSGGQSVANAPQLSVGYLAEYAKTIPNQIVPFGEREEYDYDEWGRDNNVFGKGDYIKKGWGSVYYSFRSWGGDSGFWKGLISWITIFVVLLFEIINVIVRLFGGKDLFAGDEKRIEVRFICGPWQPPIGAEDCEKCNDDPLKPCSEYRCSSLGAGCEIVNKGTETEMCDSAEDDGKPPGIISSEGIISGNTTYSNVSDDGFMITSIDGECLDAYTNLEFGITTNELSQCKFDLQEKGFENMSLDLGSSVYTYEHTATFFLPDPSHGQSQGLNWTGDLEFFIKCRDRFGHESPGFYNVDVCVKEGPDKTAPRIKEVYPDDEQLISFNVNSTNVTVITNELSTCRWDDEDVDYFEMENEMICDYSFASPSSPFGYVCVENFLTPEANNTFYIKCADQPWLENTTEVNDRNANVESFVYSLTKPERAIAINYVGPWGTFESATAETQIELNVLTSGGGDVHVCSYSLSDSGWLIEMWETGESGEHKQEIYVGSGEQKVRVRCEDETSDSASSSTEFEIIHDTSTPQIARIWQSSGRLYIITTESSECRYSTETCKFYWDDAQSAGSGDEHVISVIRGNSYYIRCKDEFGNAPTGCSVEAKIL